MYCGTATCGQQSPKQWITLHDAHGRELRLPAGAIQFIHEQEDGTHIKVAGSDSMSVVVGPPGSNAAGYVVRESAAEVYQAMESVYEAIAKADAEEHEKQREEFAKERAELGPLGLGRLPSTLPPGFDPTNPSTWKVAPGEAAAAAEPPAGDALSPAPPAPAAPAE